jgi:xanthine dehydrogenase YagS FAD-binding subunit
VTALAPGELVLEIDVPSPDRSIYFKEMDRARYAFAIVGVAAARFGADTRIAMAGVAPIPWLLGSLEDATPLPGNAYKLDLARILVERARTALTA